MPNYFEKYDTQPGAAPDPTSTKSWDTGVPSDPTEGMFGPTKLLAAAASNVRDTGVGAAQAALGAMPFMAPGFPPEIAAQLNAELEKYAKQNEQINRPLYEDPWGMTGKLGSDLAIGMAAPVGKALQAAGPLGRIGISAGVAGAQGAMVPTTGEDGDSRAWNVLKSGAMGAAGQQVANTIGALIKGAKVPTENIRAALDWVKQYGGDLTRGQVADSPFLQRVEKILASSFGSGGYYKRLGQENVRAATRGINDITGGDAGQLIEKAGAGHPFNLDQKLIDEMRAIPQSYEGVGLPPDVAKELERYVGSQTVNPALASLSPAARAQAVKQGVPEFVGGAAQFKPGQQMNMVGPYGDFNNYQAMRSAYGEAARSASTQAERTAYEAMQEALDRAAQRSLTDAGAPADAMKAAHQAYTIEKLLQPARLVNQETGEVTYDTARIASIVKNADRKTKALIDRAGPAGAKLRDIANFAGLAQPVSSSGTAEGNLAGKLTSLELFKGIASGDPLGTLLGAGSYFTFPWALKTAFESTKHGVPGLRDAPPLAAVTLQKLLMSAPAVMQDVMRLGANAPQAMFPPEEK